MSVQHEPAQLSVVVDDDGPGIALDLLEAVFQPFFRIETSGSRDTGLGLYIARDLIEPQGGLVTRVNRPEGGLRPAWCCRCIDPSTPWTDRHNGCAAPSPRRSPRPA